MVEKISVKLPSQNITISANLRQTGDKWLLCLHGLQTNKILFKNLLKNPAFNQYSFLCPDFIGFGESEKPEGFSYDLSQQLEAIISLLDHLKIDKVSVIGHSLGGIAGTMMLKEAPERILALCSLEGNLLPGDCGASRKASNVSLDEFENNTYPDLINSLKNSDEPSAETRVGALQLVPAQAFYKTSKTILDYSEKGELFEIFSSSSTPRVLMIGKNGSFESRPSGTNLKLVEIENAGHFIPLDNQSQFEQELTSFLAS
ncbi:MAG: alpha/beta hydrolase [Alphaproteobacteria bacterium]|nr:alpha/beta hydrolase [Alphaproteobacteria bacterium]MDD9920039.1 alpha/beta hydrolase [Alphaproteobacteria bacterium]